MSVCILLHIPKTAVYIRANFENKFLVVLQKYPWLITSGLENLNRKLVFSFFLKFFSWEGGDIGL